LRKQSADDCHIITIVEFAYGSGRLDHHARAGGDRISRQRAYFPRTAYLAALVAIIGGKAEGIEEKAECTQRKTGQSNNAHRQPALRGICCGLKLLVPIPFSSVRHVDLAPPPDLYLLGGAYYSQRKCLESFNCCA